MSEAKLKVSINGKEEGFAYFFVSQDESGELSICSRHFPEGIEPEKAQEFVANMAFQALKMLPIPAAIESMTNAFQEALNGDKEV